MSKKTKKVLSIIGLCVLITCAIAYIVLYCLFKEQTQTITYQVVDYICNKPLPVVGVSTLIVCIFIWKIFASSSLGKFQINKLKGICKETKEDAKSTREYVDNSTKNLLAKLDEKQKQIDELKSFIKEFSKNIPNIKLQEIIHEYLGDSEDDNKEETKDL